MEPNTRDKIIEIMEQSLVLAGAKDYDTGMAQIGKLFDYFQRNYEPMRSKEHLKALLEAMPEPPFLKKRFLFGALRYAPQLIRYGSKELVKMTEENLPEIPRGRPGLDTYKKAQIVAKVGRWHTAGYTLDQAKKRAARHFNVSESTVQRAWDDRQNRGEVDFRSVLKFIAEGSEDESDFQDTPDGIQS